MSLAEQQHGGSWEGTSTRQAEQHQAFESSRAAAWRQAGELAQQQHGWHSATVAEGACVIYSSSRRTTATEAAQQQGCGSSSGQRNSRSRAGRRGSQQQGAEQRQWSAQQQGQGLPQEGLVSSGGCGSGKGLRFGWLCGLAGCGCLFNQGLGCCQGLGCG